jgi:uncharacterized protein with PIN domain
MPELQISFINELNDLIPKRQRGKILSVSFKGRQSIKHIIESLGIPHTEAGLLIVNEQPTNFDFIVQSGDVIKVYPASPQLDLLSGMFSNGEMTIEPRFILDNHLGKLAAYLRMFGFDAAYRNDYQDDELAQITVDLSLILLTRDRQLLMRKTIRFGYLIRSLDPENQVLEIFQRFNLTDQITPFHRCLRCNNPLKPIEKDLIIHRLQPLTKKYFEEFHICPACHQLYWKGSHYDRMEKLIAKLIAASKDDLI